MALLEIKHNSSDVNDFLLIYSSTTRFKTFFLTSVTTCTSHHYENWVWTPPKINGAEKTRASKESTLHFPIHTWTHKGNKPNYFFLIFIYNKCNKIIFLASYNIFNSVKERILKRRGNWRQSCVILTKAAIAQCQNWSQQLLYINKLNMLPPSLSRHLDTHHRH